MAYRHGSAFHQCHAEHRWTGCVDGMPNGINGQIYVVLTKGNTTVTDENILAKSAVVEGDVAMP